MRETLEQVQARARELQARADNAWRHDSAPPADDAPGCGCTSRTDDGEIVTRIDGLGNVVRYRATDYPSVQAIDEQHASLLRRQSRCNGDLANDGICRRG
jgi:hypothetical protein